MSLLIEYLSYLSEEKSKDPKKKSTWKDRLKKYGKYALGAAAVGSAAYVANKAKNKYDNKSKPTAAIPVKVKPDSKKKPGWIKKAYSNYKYNQQQQKDYKQYKKNKELAYDRADAKEKKARYDARKKELKAKQDAYLRQDKLNRWDQEHEKKIKSNLNKRLNKIMNKRTQVKKKSLFDKVFGKKERPPVTKNRYDKVEPIKRTTKHHMV